MLCVVGGVIALVNAVFFLCGDDDEACASVGVRVIDVVIIMRRRVSVIVEEFIPNILHEALQSSYTVFRLVSGVQFWLGLILDLYGPNSTRSIINSF